MNFEKYTSLIDSLIQQKIFVKNKKTSTLNLTKSFAHTLAKNILNHDDKDKAIISSLVNTIQYIDEDELFEKYLIIKAMLRLKNAN